MNQFMKLEMKRNSMKKYYVATLIITFVMIGFMYLLAAIPMFDPMEQDLEMFQSYQSLSALVCMLNIDKLRRDKHTAFLSADATFGENFLRNRRCFDKLIKQRFQLGMLSVLCPSRAYSCLWLSRRF